MFVEDVQILHPVPGVVVTCLLPLCIGLLGINIFPSIGKDEETSPFGLFAGGLSCSMILFLD